MKRIVSLFAAAVLMGVWTSHEASAQTQRWTLDFEYSEPKVVTLTDYLGGSTAHWYMTFKVTNKTGAERPLSLEIKAFTDYKPNAVYPAVTDARVKAKVEEMTGKKYLDTIESKGTIADGETKDCIAVFGQINPNVDRFDVQVQGLVDTIAREGKKFFKEVKAYLIHFQRPGGDEHYVQLYRKFKDRGTEWKILERKEILVKQ